MASEDHFRHYLSLLHKLGFVSLASPQLHKNLIDGVIMEWLYLFRDAPKQSKNSSNTNNTNVLARLRNVMHVSLSAMHAFNVLIANKAEGVYDDATQTTIKPQRVHQMYDSNGRYSSSINYRINSSHNNNYNTISSLYNDIYNNNNNWKSALHVLLTKSLPGVHKVGATMGMNVFNISSHFISWHRILSYIHDYVTFVYESCVQKIEADRRESDEDANDDDNDNDDVDDDVDINSIATKKNRKTNKKKTNDKCNNSGNEESSSPLSPSLTPSAAGSNTDPLNDKPSSDDTNKSVLQKKSSQTQIFNTTNSLSKDEYINDIMRKKESEKEEKGNDRKRNKAMNNKKSNSNKGKELKQQVSVFTMDEIKEANTPNKTYTVISGAVYDITKFVHRHPGGMRLLLQYCAGQDATEKFFEVHGANAKVLELLEQFRIGVLGLSGK